MASGAGVLEPGWINQLLHQPPHELLLDFDRLGGVHDSKSELCAHPEVLLEKTLLKQPKTLPRIRRKTQVHARLEVLRLEPIRTNAVETHLQRRSEEKGQVRRGGELVDAPDPGRRTAADGIPGEGGIEIT